jgi:hypothetical protein
MSYSDFYLSNKEADERLENGVESYLVSEDDEKYTTGKRKGFSKGYDLCRGIFSTLEAARACRDEQEEPSSIYRYSDWENGNIDCIE